MIFFKRRAEHDAPQIPAHGVGERRTLRPIVVIQSDDWGRVGIPTRETLDHLKSRGLAVGDSRWDYYGLETADDIEELDRLLLEFADCDGNPPRMTANFIMANADLARMRAEGYREFRWVGIERQLPSPWSGSLMSAYRKSVGKGVLEPGLHGFTHFNTNALLDNLRKDSDSGRRARILAECDVPYLASVTPEYNFALVTRTRSEKFLDRRSQSRWVEQGASLFAKAFGARARTVCAPGYRANSVTRKLWRQAGVSSVQVVGRHGVRLVDGLVELSRNVAFEPALGDDDALGPALEEARWAARNRMPIVICTHSINYISRFLGAAGRSRQLLRHLLDSLLEEFPDLRFSGSVAVADAWKEGREGWFEAPPDSRRAKGRALASG